MKHLAILLDRDQAASPVTPNFTHPSPTPPEMPSNYFLPINSQINSSLF